MNEFFNVGDMIYGFCNGYFGRDDYDNKICVMVTSKYAVFQYVGDSSSGEATVLNNPSGLNKETTDGWKIDPFKT